MASLIKVLMGQKYGSQVPGLHLTELNPHIEAWSGEEPLLFNTENLSFHLLSSYCGMTGKSFGGTMVHAITFGLIDPKRRAPRIRIAREPMSFWPGGGGELADEVRPVTKTPYVLIGSWSEWERGVPMEEEGFGVYGRTVTLGPNRLEEFQILVDGQPDRVLHPGVPKAGSGAGTEGPSTAEASLGFRWVIDGRGPASASARGPPVDGATVAGSGLALLPRASGQKLASAALAVSHCCEMSMPGARYRARLRVAGKWRTVDWEKLSDHDPLGEPYMEDGRYYVVGSWNKWEFDDEMERSPEVPGLFYVQVGPLPRRDTGDFQVVRNRDWGQTFHPSRPEDGGERGGQVLGPSERPGELLWCLGGLPGDVFRIEFQRTADGRDARAISWRRVAGRGFAGRQLAGSAASEGSG